MFAALTFCSVAFSPLVAVRPAVSHSALSSRARSALSSRPAVYARAPPPLAFVGPEDDAADNHKAAAPATLYEKTEGGLSFKDLERGSATEVAAGDVVSIRFTATVLSTGDVVDGTRGDRVLTFPRGVPELAVFDEAIEGMRAGGGKRRVLVLPSSKWAVLSDETVELEIELVDVKRGAQAALVRAGGPVRGLIGTAFNLLFWYYITVTLLELTVLVPPSGGATAGGVDAANVWAARGLEQVGLF